MNFNALWLIIPYFISLTLNLRVAIPNFYRVASLSPASYLSLCLCCANCITSINMWIMILSASEIINLHKSSMICAAIASTAMLGVVMSISFMATLPFLRYLMIIWGKPVKKEQMWIFSACSLVFWAILAFLPMILHEPLYIPQPSELYCNLDWTTPNPFGVFFRIAALVFIGGSTVFMAVIYALIYKRLRKSVMEMESTNSRGIAGETSRQESKRDRSDSISSTEATAATKSGRRETVVTIPQGRDSYTAAAIKKQERGLLIQSVAVVAAFVIGWLPFLFRIYIEFTTGQPVSVALDMATCFCAIMQELADPIIFEYFNKEFQENMKLFLK
ncbi:hypothetical protein BDR26DRAFT_1000386 [Obelidium mucronatum]|nr:hypothetical protein BDR26DRAFT_1000386 [Obelidium mucronatum]